MAPGLTVLCLLFLCVSIIVTVEAKSTYSKPTSKPHYTSKQHYTSKPTVGWYENIQKQDKHRDVYATRAPHYGGYPASTQPPRTVKPVYNPFPKATPKPPAPSYPNSGGLSGSGSVSNHKQTSSPLQSYPNSGGLSGSGSQTNHKQTSSPLESYPNSGGLSGSGSQTNHKQTSSPVHSYPNGAGGLSGGGYNAANQQKPPPSLYPNGGGLSGSSAFNNTNKPHSYPNGGGGLSGGGYNATNQQKPPPSLYPNGGGLSGSSAFNNTNKPHSYPNGGGGLSGGGYNATNQQKPPPSLYPNGGGLSGHSAHKTTNKPHTYPKTPTPHIYATQKPWPGPVHYPNQHTPVSPVHVTHTQTSPNHIYVRDRHTTHIYHDNSPTIIHHYHYRAPEHVYYVTSDGMQYHYPTYRETLPQYVYDYRSSKSRFNVLLTGLALYNLGHLTKSREKRLYHNNYKPGPIEVCKFGVKYDTDRYDEVDIDCRLITDFIWTVRSANRNQMPINMIQRLYPNGTVIEPQVKNVGFVNQRIHPNGTLAFPQLVWSQDLDVVVDALDPRFNGGPLKVKTGMKCYMKYFDGYIFTAPVTKSVSCNLLQTYVKASFNSARKIVSSLLPIAITIAVAVLY